MDRNVMKYTPGWRIVSSEMLRRLAFVKTDVSEELSASFRVTRFCELGTTLARSVRRLLVTASVVPSLPILVTLMEFLRNVGSYNIHTA
jgi:hypothetical protein